MQFYHDENEQFTDSETVVPLTPNFNTSSYLEFQINPNGGHIQLADTRLSFSVDILESLVPENFFVSKLFEHCEINVNHTTINSKSSDSDYSLTHYFLTRMNWNEDTLKSTGSLEGYWENSNWDASHFESAIRDNILIPNPHCDIRRKEALKIVLDGETYLRYHFVVSINTGIAMSPQPLPKQVPIKITFYRADASKSLLSTVIEDNGEPKAINSDRVLKLINPILHASFLQSEHYDRKYANHRISRVSFPFLDSTVHRELLFNGVDQFKIKITEGNFTETFLFSN